MLDSPYSAAAADLPHSFFSTPVAFDDREPTIGERMAADVIIPLARQGQATHFGDLTNAGFTPAQIGAWFPKAKALADAVTFRQDAPPETLDEEPQLDPWDADADYRTIRIARAAGVIAGLVDASVIHALLRADNFSSREIGALWPQILEEAGRKLAAVGPASR